MERGGFGGNPAPAQTWPPTDPAATCAWSLAAAKVMRPPFTAAHDARVSLALLSAAAYGNEIGGAALLHADGAPTPRRRREGGSRRAGRQVRARAQAAAAASAAMAARGYGANVSAMAAVKDMIQRSIDLMR